jgi:hypothetical protein
MRVAFDGTAVPSRQVRVREVSERTVSDGCRTNPLNKEKVMKFACLICAEKVMEQMPEAETERHYEEYAEFTRAIRRSGHYVASNRLQPSHNAVTVRVRNGQVSTTDGPFAETKEQFGGYYVIEAKDLQEAVRIAARIPGAQRGCVEVRPVAEDARTLDVLGLTPG